MVFSLEKSNRNLQMLANFGSKISAVKSLCDLQSTTMSAFQQLSGISDLDVQLSYHSSVLLECDNLEDDFYFMDQNGQPRGKANVDSRVRNYSVLYVLDPRGNQVVGRVFVSDPSAYEENKGSFKALLSSVANAIAALRLEQALELIESRARDIRTIMLSLTQGVCVIDSNFCLKSEYSRSLETLVGEENLGGQSYERAILDKFDLSSEQKSLVKSVLVSSFTEPLPIFEVNSHCLPSKVAGRGNSKDYELDWTAMLGPDECLNGVLLSIRDVTELGVLRLQSQEKQRFMELLDQVVQMSPASFEQLMGEGRRLIEVCRALPSTVPLDPSMYHSIRIDLHTLKGNSRRFGLQGTSKIIHELEAVFVRRSQNVDDVTEELGLALQRLDLCFQELWSIHRDKLRRVAKNQGHGLSAQDEPTVIEFHECLQKLDNVNFESVPKGAIGDILSGKLVSVHGLVSSLAPLVTESARTLNKTCPVLNVQLSGDYLERSYVENVRSALVHILNNCVDHGCGSEGVQFIKVFGSFNANDRYVLRVRDSGHGLKLKKLREKFGQGNVLTDESLAELVFGESVSTSEAVTEVSGYGVGLSAVKDYIEQIGGQVKIEYLEKSGTDMRKFEFLAVLPEGAVVSLSEVIRQRELKNDLLK